MNKQKTKQVNLDAGLPDLSKWVIFSITFGFLGINMGFSLQSSQMSRIFQSIGANPNSLGFFFIFPGLMGMIVQPLIGKYSDRTWNRFGQRMPYLLFGAPIAVRVLLMLPFSGSLGFDYGSMAAMAFAAFAVCFMGLFNNICMQPFRMIVGDMVNNKQKNFAWSLQQIFFNGGGILASLLPFIFTACGMHNTAKRGVVPNTVIYAYVVAAAVLLITSMWTIFNVKDTIPRPTLSTTGSTPRTTKSRSASGTSRRSLPGPFGNSVWCSFSAGSASCMFGLTQPAPSRKTSGTRLTPPVPAFKRPATGTESSPPSLVSPESAEASSTPTPRRRRGKSGTPPASYSVELAW